jgi:hypothetical protein
VVTGGPGAGPASSSIFSCLRAGCARDRDLALLPRRYGRAIGGGLQLQPEGGALARLGFQSHPAAHPFDGFFHDGQADAGPVLIAVDPVKNVENLPGIGGRNSDAVVLKPEPHVVPGFLAPNLHAGLFSGLNEFDGIAEKI